MVLKVRLHSQQESTKTDQAMTQTEHGLLNQQFEAENKDVNKLKEELLNLTQERDTYKMKLDEFQNHLEAAKVGINTVQLIFPDSKMTLNSIQPKSLRHFTVSLCTTSCVTS